MTLTADPALTSDPRPLFLQAVDTAVDAVAGVHPDRLGDPTPCTEYDVRALLGHLLCVLRRVAAVGRGEDALSVPQVVTGVPDDGWHSAARAAADGLRAVWRDPALLGRPLRLPFGTLPGAAALSVYAGELTVHTWDLAAATGQSPAYDDAVVALATAAAHRALPADQRGPQVPFGPVVPTGPQASAVERLVAWQGRDPRWRP